MIVYSSLAEAKADRKRCSSPVVTVGFFDGLHQGHHKLLGDLKHWASEIGGEPLVVTFDRHPRAVTSANAPPSIFSIEYRLLLMEREGIAGALVLHFDEALSRWSPEEFLKRVLIQTLGCRHLLLGFDSAVGHRRQGDFEYLSEKSGELGISVRSTSPFFLGGKRVSSTLVREAVFAGDLTRIEELTGRPYGLLGRVVPGDRRGKSLGFPTANIDIEVGAVLPGGVYFAQADRVDSLALGTHGEVSKSSAFTGWPTLVNIGRRPTFSGQAAATASAPGLDAPFDPSVDRLEAHLLDFSGNLYGDMLEIRFLHYQRPEQRFSSPEELSRQIRRDEKAIREWLARSGRPPPSI